MKKLLTSGTLSSYRPRVDGSFSITVNIMIPSKEQRDVIQDLYQQEVVIYLKEGTEVRDVELEIIDTVEIDLNRKTPSQRLKNTLFVLWSQKPEGFTDFPSFYKFKMEAIITKIKGLLDS